MMRPLILAAGCLTLASVSGCCQAPDALSFEVASIKQASPSARAIRCSGGPGTADPANWSCSNVPLGFLITQAYGFEAYQFRPNHPCCQARFDFNAKVPPGTTKEQFHRMLRNLLEQRFRLALHLERKEMPIYNLTVAESGLKMKPSAPDAAPLPEDPWESPTYTIGKDGYPEFPSGRGGLVGANGHYRWAAFDIPMPEIVKTLSFYLGRPVVDATGLLGKYDINLKWGIDMAWILENSGLRDQIKELPDTGPTGPTLLHAVQDQLGLKLTSAKGSGDLVVVDHLEKLPTEN